jgi:hypothetical protein
MGLLQSSRWGKRIEGGATMKTEWPHRRSSCFRVIPSPADILFPLRPPGRQSNNVPCGSRRATPRARHSALLYGEQAAIRRCIAPQLARPRPVPAAASMSRVTSFSDVGSALTTQCKLGTAMFLYLQCDSPLCRFGIGAEPQGAGAIRGSACGNWISLRHKRTKWLLVNFLRRQI